MSSSSLLYRRPPRRDSGHDWSGVSEAAYAYALTRIRKKEVAEDIAQEAVVRCIEYCLTHEVASVYALAYRVAGNLIADHYRLAYRNGGELPLDLESEEPLPDQIVAGRLEVERLAEAIDDLPPLRREVFLRRRLHGESSVTIAQALDLTPKAIEKHITRAFVALNKALERRAGKRNDES